MEYRVLGNTGLMVSVLGFGAASLGTKAKEVDEHTSARTLREALDLGINLIDVSPYYGQTRAETIVGLALKGVPRSQYILATKAGRYGKDAFDFSPSRIVESLEESLRRLGTDYIDIFQLHDIEYAPLEMIINQSLPALEKLKQSGTIRYYGITGYPLHIFRTVAKKAHLDTIQSYAHYTLQNSSLTSILPMMQMKGIGVMNASPLSMGLLTSRGPFPWHPADEGIKTNCKRAVDFCKVRGLDLAELALQFSLLNEQVATTIIGTARPESIRKNVEVMERKPDLEAIAQVQAFLQPVQGLTWPSGLPENQDA